jgi:hypothetical protein
MPLGHAIESQGVRGSGGDAIATPGGEEVGSIGAMLVLVTPKTSKRWSSPVDPSKAVASTGDRPRGMLRTRTARPSFGCFGSCLAPVPPARYSLPPSSSCTARSCSQIQSRQTASEQTLLGKSVNHRPLQFLTVSASSTAWGIDVTLAHRSMPRLRTVWVSTVRKTTLSTSRPMMITVVRPANT